MLDSQMIDRLPTLSDLDDAPARSVDQLLGESDRDRRAGAIALLVLMLLTIAVRGWVLDRAYRANAEGTCAGPLLCVARNYVRYGPAAARFGGVINAGQVPRDQWIVYAHHPPTVPLLVAALQAVAGENEWTARLPSALFSVGCTALIFVMIRRRFGWVPAFASGAIYALCPLTLAFGDMPDYVNAQTVFFALATVECYLRFFETRRRAWLGGMAAAFVLGAISDWPIFYLVPLLCAHALLRGGRRALIAIVLFGAASTAVFALVALWTGWTGGDGSIFSQLAHRTFDLRTDGARGHIGLVQWVDRVILQHQWDLHTPLVLGLVVIYGLATLRRLTTRQWATLRRHDVVLLMLGWAVLHLLIGMQGNYQHEWWSVILTPGLAMAAGLVVAEIIAALPRPVLPPLPSATIAAIAVLAFAVPSARIAKRYTMREFNDRGGWKGYSLRDLGTTIRQISADDEGVLTSDYTDWTSMTAEPGLWWYADRQLRPGITNIERFRANLGAGAYPIYYGWVQPAGPRPRWFVIPEPTRSWAYLKPLATELDATYAVRVVNGFRVYQLW